MYVPEERAAGKRERVPGRTPGRVRPRARLFSHWHLRLASALALIVSLVCSGCFLDTEVEPFYGRVNVPRRQEFRWSDGGLPQTFDPALAAAPPETDVVRALFEGLTDYDPRTLAPVAGVAARWESSADKRVWTFHLRRDARWSNGAPVTAQDFVRSWQRTLRLGDRAPHAKLLANIVGAADTQTAPPAPVPAATPAAPAPAQAQRAGAAGDAPDAAGAPEAARGKASAQATPAPAFGVEAVDD